MTRKLTDHEGYEVDTDGNVYSKYRRLKPTVKRNGYLQVSLGRSKVAMVHRLVAEAFLPNPDNLPCINHKIYDKKLGTRPLARRFNVDPAAILSVLRNKTWKHIT